MVSEGVDIPRLRVGVYATPARTELFFRQVVGRFIRRTPGRGEQMSWLFMPSDLRLKALAAAVEEERRHALVDETAGIEEEAPEVERGPRADDAFHALSSTGRLDDLLATSSPGDQLGLFGAPVPPPAPATAAAAPSRPVEETSYERRERLREERAGLVRDLSRQTGEPFRAIHARINQATGARSVAAATEKQLIKGNALLEKKLRR
jgi:superfamily II DNA or RNA helicase